MGVEIVSATWEISSVWPVMIIWAVLMRGPDEFNEINRCSVIHGCLVTRISGLKESLDTDPSNCLAFSRDSLLSLTAIYQLAALELSQGKGRKMKPEVT